MNNKKRLVGIVALVGLIALILLGLLGKLTVSEKNNKNSKETQRQILKTEKNVQRRDSSVKQVEDPQQKKEDVDSGLSNSIISSETKNSDIASTTDDLEIIKAVPPKVRANQESRALIMEKEIFKTDNVYLFSLKLTLPREGKEAAEVRYFTTAANFDKVKSGDLLKVVYGEDDGGNIIIASVDLIQ